MSKTALKKIGLLSRLDDDDLSTLAEFSERLTCELDQDILLQGQRNDSIFLVQEGVLHVRRGAKDREVHLGRLEAGSFFGEISLFDPGPTTATVRAVSDGVLIRIRRRHLDAFRERRPAGAALLLLGLLEETSKRLRRVDERLVEAILRAGLLR